MGVLTASLAVTMLLAVALSGSDEGSGLAIKSAKLSQAKAVPAMSLHKMEQDAMLPSSLLPRVCCSVIIKRMRCWIKTDKQEVKLQVCVS